MIRRLRERRRALRITTGRPARAGAWLIVRFRHLIVLGWILAAALATLYLPAPSTAQTSDVGSLVPANAPALRTELRSLRYFPVPLLARSAVVQRDPNGLSAAAQGRVVERAVAVDQHAVPALREIEGALPITNTLKLFPSSRESSTTAITYLFFSPDLNFYQQRALAYAYARQVDRPGDALVGVTGSVPARVEQGDLIERAIPWVEVATVAMIGLIVGLAFRSVGAPLATLAAATIAYLVSIRVVTSVGERFGVAVPQDLEPVLIVLLLGIVTDYSIFFLFGVRDRLRAGQRRLDAAEATTANFLPIIVTAGLTVAAGTAALVVASLDLLRAFGPALSVSVLVSLAVAVTFVPSVLAIFGRALFWPSRRGAAGVTVAATEEPPSPTEPQGPEGHPDVRFGWRDRLGRVLTWRPVALVTAVLIIGALIVAANWVRSARLGFSLVQALPPSVQERRAAEAAGQGFAPGIVSPVEILLEAPGLGDQRGPLARFEDLLGRQPGIAAVLGPREEETWSALVGEVAPTAGPQGSPSTGSGPGLAVAKDGSAARIVAILDRDPLGGVAIADVRALQARLPAIARQAGLGPVRIGVAGDTALAADTVTTTLGDLGRIALATLLVDLLLLVLFLRSLVAPLYLLATSVLALLASLGLTTYVVQTVVGVDHLTYYVPFAVAVLLVSLGSDYNIFIVGRMWEEARARPLPEAVAVGARRATRPITLAGLTLAGSFALLALVPVGPFREFAFAMAVGVLLDSFVVRSFLVPALVSLFGRASFWPGRVPQTAEARVPVAA